ncbi:MAG: TonB-dependent receptor, partial [Bacteroidota bacterium]
GYDPGGFENNAGSLDSDKFLVRLDYNISQNHKLTARYFYTSADNVENLQSNDNTIAFQNRAESFVSKTNSLSLELKSNFGNNFSNKFVFGYTRVRDDRDPTGQDFPTVNISDGSGDIEFGAEPFSTANLLDQDIVTITNDFEIYSGKHTITVGTHNEFYKINNLFIAFNFGEYDYATLNDFLTDQQPTSYFRNFSQVDLVTGDESQAAAAFNAFQLGFYVQDEFQASDRFKLTAGLRIDIPVFDDTPVNDDFNTNTIPAVAQYYSLEGAQTGNFIDPQVLFSPRLGFNWDILGNQSVQLRGGVGIFTSRVPLVWPGGAYNNYGFNIGAEFDEPAQFIPDVNAQPGTPDLENPRPSGQIDLFAENFKVPQVLKTDIAVDYQLPWGMVATLEFLYTKVLVAPRYQNLNLRPSTANLTGSPDDRPIFDRRDEIDPTYSRILLATNTSKGYSYNLIAQLQKPFDNGLSMAVSYNYGDSFSLFDGTSSQNSSQWRGIHAVNGRNNQTEVQRSTFAGGHRVLAQVSYRKEYLKFFSSQISLIYNGQNANPTSFIYNDNGNLNVEDSRERNLIFVPRTAADINLVQDGDRSPEVQWAELNRFIESDPYLRTRRGQYAERNGRLGPFNSVVDLRFLQEFFIETGNGTRNTLQFSVDIFNFSNMLNKNWGRIRDFSSDEQIINFEGFEADGTTPTFTYGGFNNDDVSALIDGGNNRSSRWRMQLGIRYIFN